MQEMTNITCGNHKGCQGDDTTGVVYNLIGGTIGQPQPLVYFTVWYSDAGVQITPLHDPPPHLLNHEHALLISAPGILVVAGGTYRLDQPLRAGSASVVFRYGQFENGAPTGRTLAAKVMVHPENPRSNYGVGLESETRLNILLHKRAIGSHQPNRSVIQLVEDYEEETCLLTPLQVCAHWQRRECGAGVPSPTRSAWDVASQKQHSLPLAIVPFGDRAFPPRDGHVYALAIVFVFAEYVDLHDIAFAAEDYMPHVPQMACDVKRAVDELHSLDVVHADVKPENMLCKRLAIGRPITLLCDFMQNTSTFGYKAPELHRRFGTSLCEHSRSQPRQASSECAHFSFWTTVAQLVDVDHLTPIQRCVEVMRRLMAEVSIDAAQKYVVQLASLSKGAAVAGSEQTELRSLVHNLLDQATPCRAPYDASNPPCVYSTSDWDAVCRVLYQRAHTERAIEHFLAACARSHLESVPLPQAELYGMDTATQWLWYCANLTSAYTTTPTKRRWVALKHPKAASAGGGEQPSCCSRFCGWWLCPL